MNNTITGSGGNGNGRALSSPPAIASINDELPLSNVGRGVGPQLLPPPLIRKGVDQEIIVRRGVVQRQERD